MFSVVIPAYNCEKTIVRVVDSVKNQTRKDLIEEIIIVNDGSIDNTDLVIKNYIEENKDLPIKYFSQTNHGVSYTRNYGIKVALAEWIALLDADDLWLPNKIERQYEIVKEKPEIVFLGSSYPFYKGFKKYTNGLYKLSAKELCIRSVPVTPSVIFLKRVGVELGLFDENMRYSEDINFFQKFLLRDSYYILVENLVNCGIEKKFHASSGASSNLSMMNRGRNKNVIELNKMKLISKPFMYLMLMFNTIKLTRRETILLINKILFMGRK